MKKQLREQVNRVRRSQDARALVENFISLSILKALAFVLPLVTLPYLSRVIGVARFGDIAFASSIIVYFMTITDYGFNYTATRDLSKNRTNLEYVRHLFWNVLYTKMVLLTISVVIFAVLVEAIPFLREYRLLLWLTFLTVPSYMLFPEWFFQGIEKMRYITIVNVISKVVFTALIFLLIRQESDYVLHPALNAFGFLVAGVISQVIILRKYKVYPVRFSWRDVKQTLRSGWDVFLSLIAPNLYSSTTTIFLQTFHGGVASGLFSSGRTFVDIADQISLIFSRVFFPFLARRPEKHHVFRRITFTIQLLAVVVLFIGADWIIGIFYAKEFAASANVLRIMSVSLVFMYLMNAYGTNYLLLHKLEKTNRKIVIYSSIAGFFISYIFAWQWGYIGAALTFVTVRGAMGIVTWICARKHMNLHRIEH
ncbi:flippase [Porphyromonas levii]|uniref:Flippase n=1 Tax=Porphyromonas levii TaxID=28114 RepID=A0A4Y8WMP7_9PORP|nr:flippase [Porphyromonas levii]TFH94280.1 flippase [Porphyromonas levii]TFH97023.1 flippase [Porphyromonas levii]